MRVVRLISILIVFTAFAILSANAPSPVLYDAVTAATGPLDDPLETVANLQAEIIYWEEKDLDGGWTPYQDVLLTWEPTPSGGETAYEIWATTTTGAFEMIDTVNTDTTEYTDHFIGMTYEEVEVISYMVRPFFDGDPGLFCDAVSINNPGYGR
jgi:hypothetical protein